MDKEKKYLLIREKLEYSNERASKLNSEISKNTIVFYLTPSYFVILTTALMINLLIINNPNVFALTILTSFVSIIFIYMLLFFKFKNIERIFLQKLMKHNHNFKIFKLNNNKKVKKLTKELMEVNDNILNFERELQKMENGKDKLNRDLLEKHMIKLLLSGKINKSRDFSLSLLKQSLSSKNLKKLKKESLRNQLNNN